MTQEDGWGKVIWIGIDDWEGGTRRECEAPRHQGQGVPSGYIMATILSTEGIDDTVIQGMCDECMDMMAKDLGTTATEGRYKG